MSYLVRCSCRLIKGPRKGKTCGWRYALRKKPQDYVRKPRCINPDCKGKYLTYIDNYQMKKNRENLCYCDALPNSAPHRKASTVWCIEHPTGPTEEDYIDRYGNI